MRSNRAFSLIEVALALGIIAFALVAILGMIPVGLNASRDAIDDTRTSLIAQDVANRVRAEISTVGDPLDYSDPVNPQPIPTGALDFRWHKSFSTKPGYLTIGNTVLPLDSDTGKPGPAAAAYYTAEGLFIKEATEPASNFYKAAIFIRPFPHTATAPAVSYQSLNLPVSGTAPNVDYPLLAVTVYLGWPTETTRDGKVLGPIVNAVKPNATRSSFTFYLRKP